MKLKFILRAIAALMLVSAASAQDTPRSEADKLSQTLTDAYVAAFNKGDAKALAAMYAEDVQSTSDDGETVVGRATVLAGLTEFFAKNKGATVGVKIESARFLTPDVLIEKGFATVGEETTKYVCNYVKKDGTWLISELNETTLPPANAATLALEELSWLVGKWKDNAPGVNVTAAVDSTKNGHFLRRSVTITNEDDETTEATEVIGYDPVAGQVRSWVFDSDGGFGEGMWRRDGNKWLVAFRATAPDGTMSSAQHVLTFVDEKKFTWESINRQSDGEALPNIDKIEVVRSAAE